MINGMKLNAYSSATGKLWLGILALLQLALLALAFSPGVDAQPSPPPFAGVWIDHTGRGAVEISSCGSSLCGHIAWLKDPTQPNGAPVVDQKGRPVCGLQIIGELKRQSDGSWDDGWIYDPEKDEKYSVELRLKSQDTLQVVGYLGMKMLGETFVWKRAPATQARCTTAKRRST